MQKPRRFSTLRFRLSAAVSAITLMSILLLAALFVWKDFDKTISGERARLSSIATAYAAAAADAAAGRDQREMLEVLRGIGALPDIVFAGISAPDGQVIAEIGGSVVLAGQDGLLAEQTKMGILSASTLTVRAPITQGGQNAGSIELQADITAIRTRYLRGLAQLLAIGVGALLLTGFSANWLVARMTGPLSRMTRDLVAMGDEPDLSHRFQHAKPDEVGVFAAAFNDAFARIEERDAAIRRHRDTLEETVAIRTAELRVSVIEAERANAAKSDFLATMSHEIRTPMNGMLVMAELLAASPLAPKQRRQAQVISRSGHSLLNIINDILDMSKIEAGRLELEHVPFSIDTLIGDTVSLFSARAHERGLSLGVHVQRDVARAHIGDPTRLGQVIGNLVNNALKFTEAGGVTIHVGTLGGEDTPDRQRIRITVEDTGIGIAADKVERIFEAFSQADQSITRTHGGTGLGLTISRKLVDAMEGEIGVESELGAGSRFFVDLELPVDDGARSEQVADMAGHCLLLLDNDPISRAATVAGLAEYGLAVCDDGDGAAFDLIAGRPAETAAYLDAHGGMDAAILLLRGYGVDGDTADAVEAAQGELSLPLMRSDIEKLVNAMADGQFHVFDAQGGGEEPIHENVDFHGLSVLAVDDNAVNREVLNEALTAVGVNAVFASSGAKAVEAFSAQPFDIVFMDCSMPGMDGYQATAEIRRIEEEGARSPARVVALTAHVTGAEADRWRESGMDDYVAKPFTIEQLCRQLEIVQRSAGQDGEGAAGQGAGEPVREDTAEELLSHVTMEMFATVSALNGVDMKRKVFSLFIENAPKGVDDVAAAVTDGAPPQEIAYLVHSLKSMCSSAGAARAAAECDGLEEVAKRGGSPRPAEVRRLHDLVDRTIVAMFDSLAVRPQNEVSSGVAS